MHNNFCFVKAIFLIIFLPHLIDHNYVRAFDQFDEVYESSHKAKHVHRQVYLTETSDQQHSSQELTSTIDQSNVIYTDEPEFLEPIPNITVALGRDAKIPCLVRNLGSYQVAWMRVESQTILTIHNNVITRNYRIGLTQSDNRKWELQIRQAQESDRGAYMCQINTTPMKYQVAYFDVVVPPTIITAETSQDVMVRENANVTIRCRAKGYPKPKISWRRENGKPIEFGNWQELKNSKVKMPEVYEEESISINKVSRLHMGAYLCIASNGVPPSISKRIILNVNFPPMIWIPEQLIGAILGSEVTLTCTTEAFPVSINYWTKDDGEALPHSTKYEIINKETGYKVHMVLRIKNFHSNDYGKYRCIARNALGSTEGSIRIYEEHKDNFVHDQSLFKKMSSSAQSHIYRNDTKKSFNKPSTKRKMLIEEQKLNSRSTANLRCLISFNWWSSVLIFEITIRISLSRSLIF